MKKENELEGAIRRFLVASKDAVKDKTRLSEMAGRLRFMMNVTGKDRIDLVVAKVADRASIDRWLAGSHNPSPSSRRNLVAFFKQVNTATDKNIDSDARFLATMLQDDRFRLAIEYLIDQEIESINHINLRGLLGFAIDSAETSWIHDMKKLKKFLDSAPLRSVR